MKERGEMAYNWEEIMGRLNAIEREDVQLIQLHRDIRNYNKSNI